MKRHRLILAGIALAVLVNTRGMRAEAGIRPDMDLGRRSFLLTIETPQGTLTSRPTGFALEFARPDATNVVMGPAAPSRVNIGPLVVTKPPDTVSPSLALFCCKGQRLSRVTLDIVNDRGLSVIKYTLRDAAVASIRLTSGSPGGDEPVSEQVSFVFGSIEWQFASSGSGEAGGALTGGWDLAGNRPRAGTEGGEGVGKAAPPAGAP